MSGRSRTGCLTCRQRKLKCDEQRPRCGQCQKGDRTCVPANPIVFRHQQNASMNGPDNTDNTLKDFYRYKNSFDKDHVWVSIPRQISFIINADPDADQDLELLADADIGLVDQKSPTSLQSDSSGAVRSGNGETAVPLYSPLSHASGPDALSAAASVDRRMGSAHSLTPASPAEARTEPTLTDTPSLSATPALARSSILSPPLTGLSSSHHLNLILNHSTASSSSFSPPLDSSVDRDDAGLDSINIDLETETDHETAFLLRHFSEGPGQWMDLFDLGGFFAYYIPVKAIANPLLKHAAAAYAAKQLSRVQGRKAIMGGYCSQQAFMELPPHLRRVDWENKGMQHYDKAIELLKEAMLNDASGDAGAADMERDPVWHNHQYLEPTMMNSGSRSSRIVEHGIHASDVFVASSMTISMDRTKRRKVSRGKTNSDEMAAATAILCVYEFLDGSIGGWTIQLDGTKSLLDIAENHMVPLQTPHILPRPRLSKARRATFWNFARQDFLSALLTEHQTRLDPDDLPMWKDAGILIDKDGFVLPSNTTASGYPEGQDTMKEDMISNALIWIMARIVNYCVAADTPPATIGGNPRPWEGINQMTLHRKWEELHKQLSVWYEGLPDTFKPCAGLLPSSVDPGARSGVVFPEIWFSLPMCASTMQWYHYAQMLLLINQPQHSTIGKTTFHKRFGSYKSIALEIEFHARIICGIAASRPEASVRIHMIQPLYLAGQCFEGRAERLETLRLLRAIQHDTGWASEYRAKQLLQLWQWPDNVDVM